MDVIVERPAALDVHKEQVTACVRVPTTDGKRAQEVREFKTTVGGLPRPRKFAWCDAYGNTREEAIRDTENTCHRGDR